MINYVNTFTNVGPSLHLYNKPTGSIIYSFITNLLDTNFAGDTRAMPSPCLCEIYIQVGKIEIELQFSLVNSAFLFQEKKFVFSLFLIFKIFLLVSEREKHQ